METYLPDKARQMANLIEESQGVDFDPADIVDLLRRLADELEKD